MEIYNSKKFIGYIICFNLQDKDEPCMILDKETLIVYETIKEAVIALRYFIKNGGFDNKSIENKIDYTDSQIDQMEWDSKHTLLEYGFVFSHKLEYPNNIGVHPYYDKFLKCHATIKPIYWN
jgi:hypothetical protein